VERPQLDVSVVIVSFRSSATILRCLAALVPQIAGRRAELVVVDSADDGVPALIARRFPSVRVIESSTRLFPGDARNVGIAATTGRIVAFADADTIVAPNWIDAILAAHDRPRSTIAPIVGGSVDNATTESTVAWANHFCEFSCWLPPGSAMPDRRLPDVPTCCFSVTREAVRRYGPFVEGTYCSDTVFNMRAAANGTIPVFDPSIRTAHIGIVGLGAFTRKRLWHGRSYARIRVAEQRFPAWKRIGYALASPLIAVVLFGRCARRIARLPSYRAHFVHSSPLVAYGMAMWAAGEAIGYLERA
jgi:GT2 family glycosyltransferase